MSQSACKPTDRMEDTIVLNEAISSEANETMEMLAMVLSMSDDDHQDDSLEGDDDYDGYWSEDEYAVIKAYYENEEEEDEETTMVLREHPQMPLSIGPDDKL
ncbi:hypothetical protein DFQ28_004763 [Apophysomyces sp. BC1034]|nr:hypothetical protein DFQ30_004634 [Apophysomyces sp. BC1015]KAG0178265.1 hypothetical protein DFQ29_003702 [Apophysomyces sp. BC1021]KAG0188500.1 hypothetical protein DFQ28_004763 [Apophysomyces sp. BC1034]